MTATCTVSASYSTFYFDANDNIYAGEPVDGTDTLYAGDTLTENTALVSQSGRYHLQYQGDDNLVLVDTSTSPWSVLWASGTNDNSPGFVVMQLDGNVQIFNGSAAVVWSSSTAGNSGAYLAGFDDHLANPLDPGLWSSWSRGL